MTGTPGTRTVRVRVLTADDEPGRTEWPSTTLTEARRRPSPAAGAHDAPRPESCGLPCWAGGGRAGVGGRGALWLVRGCVARVVVFGGMPSGPGGVQVRRASRHGSRGSRGFPCWAGGGRARAGGVLLACPRPVLGKGQGLDHVRGSAFDGGGSLAGVHRGCVSRGGEGGR